jgi:hypothetical protein
MSFEKFVTSLQRYHHLNLKFAEQIVASHLVRGFSDVFRTLPSPVPNFFELLCSQFVCYAVFDYLNFITVSVDRYM